MKKKKMIFKKFIRLGKLMGNDIRRDIVILCADKEYNITELQKLLKVRSYRGVYEQIDILSRENIVKTRKVYNEKGKAIMVKTNKDKIIKDFTDAIIESLKEMADLYPSLRSEKPEVIKTREDLIKSIIIDATLYKL